MSPLRLSSRTFQRGRKNSPEKVESHLHNCFYDVAGVRSEERRTAEATFLISFDLVRMNTSLMNVHKTSEVRWFTHKVSVMAPAFNSKRDS